MRSLYLASIQILLLLFLAGCRQAEEPATARATAVPTLVPPSATPSPVPPTSTPLPSETSRYIDSSEQFVAVEVDVHRGIHPISPLIYGLSGASEAHIKGLRPTLTSWGGNPSTRYNWELGHAWNAGSDWLYRNGNYGYTGESASDEFVVDALESGLEVRLALPTLGWVARDDNNDTCSFPLPDGQCGDANGANCKSPGEIADPLLANVSSDEESIAAWVQHLYEEQGFDIRFLAMDNEPELWGQTHYDVHPTCTTYEEILQKYLTYATAVRRVAPYAELTGPVLCCWFSYWNTAPGPTGGGYQDFLPWFLDGVRQYDEESGQRSLNVLDVHYYPQGDVYNDVADEVTAARRLRSTRSLWDRSYVDESWIGDRIYFIPRMKQLLQEHYPRARLGISEWNWGADETMNGALAIADVLGIFGREDVYFAAYWRVPPLNKPGFYAFKMYTNYDDQGGRFGDIALFSQSDNVDDVSSYAALDSQSDNLHLMLINKQPEKETAVSIILNNFIADSQATQYRYQETESQNIVESQIDVEPEVIEMLLPPYSITLLVLEEG